MLSLNKNNNKKKITKTFLKHYWLYECNNLESRPNAGTLISALFTNRKHGKLPLDTWQVTEGERSYVSMLKASKNSPYVMELGEGVHQIKFGG